MSTETPIFAFIAIVLGLAGLAWAFSWSGKRRWAADRVSTHWDLVYMGDDGIVLFTLVRILSVNLETRRLTAWCSHSGAQRVFKFSKIIKATDVHSGMRVDVARWAVRQHRALSAGAEQADAEPTSPDLNGLWRQLHGRAH